MEWKENTYNYWKEFIKSKNNMPIVIENVLDETYDLIEDLMKRVDDENFNVCIDIGHANVCSHISVDEWMDKLDFKLNHIHLHNNYGDKDSHFGINKGNMDIIKILHKLNEKKYDDLTTLKTDLESILGIKTKDLAEHKHKNIFDILKIRFIF